MLKLHALGIGIAAGLCLVVPALLYGQKPEEKPVEKPATVKVLVPADATIDIDGTRTKQTGAERQFVTPPLPPDKVFSYTIKVNFVREGRIHTFIRVAEVSAGKDVTVDLRDAKDDDTTVRVIYVPTPQVVVDKMLEMAEVKKGDVVYDLGCGDARIIVTAAKKFGCKCVGVDLDPDRIKDSKENVAKNEVGDLVEIRQGDALKVEDIGKANVVTLYMLPEFNRRLAPILLKELKPGSRVISHDYLLPDWKSKETLRFKGPTREHILHYYIVPEPTKP